MATITLLSASVPPVDNIQRRSIRDNQIADLESILCDGGRIWPALTSAGRFEGCISTACIGAFSTLGSFLESELCLALDDLSDMSKESISLSRHVSENLLPSLRNTVRSDESSPILKALLHFQNTALSITSDPGGAVVGESSMGLNLKPSHVGPRSAATQAFVLQHGSDARADDGPRKRPRLSPSTATPRTDSSMSVTSKQILQLLGLADTAALFEAGPSARYV
ncbi:MAG: hypothetical protein Q9177_001233 [Variospora cf. flavescens]